MNQRWMGGIRKTNAESKRKGKYKPTPLQQKLFNPKPRSHTQCLTSKDKVLGSASIDLLALTFDTEAEEKLVPRVTRRNDQEDSSEAETQESEEEGQAASTSPKPGKRAKRLLEIVEDEEHDDEPIQQLTPRPPPPIIRVYRKPTKKLTTTNSPSKLSEVESRTFRKPVDNPPTETSTSTFRKPPPKSPAVISKAMLQMDALVPIPSPRPSKSSVPAKLPASTRPDFSLDKVIVADEFEDVKLNCNEK